MKKNIKKLLMLTLVMVVSVVCFIFSASAEKWGDFEYTVLEDGTVEISGYNGYASSIEIPSEIDGKSVTSIGYMSSVDLVEVTIPETVTKVQYMAFADTPNVEKFNFSGNIQEIEGYAFNFTKWFELQPQGVVYADKVAIAYAGEMPANTTLQFKDGTVSVGYYAFLGQVNLKSVIFPDSIKKIDFNAFYDCYNLESVSFPEGFIDIHEAFTGTAWLENQPDGLVYAGDNLYTYKGTAPRNSNIVIPEGVKSISICAFGGQSNIRTISVPSTVELISTSFNGCSKLEAFNVAANNPYFKSVDGVLFSGDGKVLIKYPTCKDSYYEVPSTVEEIAANAFYENTIIDTVVFKEGLKIIGNDAFGYCSYLEEVTIPSTVEKIGDWAFEECSYMESLNIPENSALKYVGYGAFYKVKWIASAMLPDSVEFIGGSAFYGCTSLYNANVPANAYVENSAFDGTPWLASFPSGTVYLGTTLYCYNGTAAYGTTINIKDGTKLIVSECFMDQSGITEVTFPEGLEIIGYSAFENCTGIEEIKIPGSVKEIGYTAFKGCSSVETINVKGNNKNYYSEDDVLYTADLRTLLFCAPENDFYEDFEIPEGVVYVESYAFMDNNWITSVTIPSTVDSIWSDAFKYATALETVYFEEGTTYIGGGAFDNCNSLKDIHLPASLEEMGDTFYGCSGLSIYYAGDIYQWMNVEGWETVSDYFSVNTQPHIHTEITVKGKAATCKATGLTDGKKCTVCSVMTVPQKTIAKLAHKYSNNCDTTCNVCSTKRTIKHTYSNNCDTTCNVCSAKRTIKHTYSNNCDTTCNVCKAKRSISHAYKTVVATKATLSKNGKTVSKCSVCGAEKSGSTKTVYYPKTIKLSATSYVYDGKTKTPSVTVKDYKGNTLKKDTDYTVKYSSGRKSTGKYSVTITFKGKYSGTKTLTFTIVPKAVTLSKVTAGSKAATPAWKTVSGASGYQVMYSTSSKFKSAKTATVSKGSSKKTTIKKLTKGKKYYFKVRAYKTVGSTKIYGAWSSVKSVKVK